MKSSHRRLDTVHPDRAIVIGASIAGLLAARVLSERFAQVLVLERDVLPDVPAPRKGVPQTPHAHGLLARGREALEELFPGFTAALIEAGGESGDLQQRVAFLGGGRRFMSGVAGQHGLCASRSLIEHEIRNRVRALPNVVIRDNVNVVEPLHSERRRQVLGVRLRDRALAPGANVVELDSETGLGVPEDAETLLADLVVDATGRGSKAPKWLKDWGYAAPVEDRVAAGVNYATAYYERHPHDTNHVAVICTSTPDHPFPAVMLAQEPAKHGGDRWVVTVAGHGADRPALTAAGMRERAASAGAEEIIHVTRNARMLGDVQRYGFPHSQRRRYERLREFPEGFLVTGDAIASFNPVYGQGMTVAACEALALQTLLQHRREGLWHTFFRDAARIVDTPWQTAVSNDTVMNAAGKPVGASTRFVHAWLQRVFHAAQYDARVARAFLRVMQMVRQPPSLFAPHIAARVLWQNWQHRNTRRTTAVLPAMSAARSAEFRRAG